MQRLMAALAAVLICSGCLRATTMITVKQDGSGTIDQDIGMTAQAVALMRNLSQAGGDAKGGANAMFGPEQAQKAALAMGVRFVSGEALKTAELEGYRAHFAFDDVTKIKVDLSSVEGGAMGATGGAPAEPPVSFAFAKGGGTSVLTIRTSDRAGSLVPKLPGGMGSPQESAQALAMATPMLRGMFVDVALTVEGRVVNTTAPFVSGSQVTLIQLDFDKLAAAPGALQKLLETTDPKLLKDLPGLKMMTDPAVTVEFGK